ncbi:hypothetical protein D7319_28660 [Streptomyces radicis]|uniref:Uncharacterized protein n=1 Tax=Streptomyces radicis TaxID=1750517 RepID=A0A3A9VTT9_9ACTN|nr:hypothetical protein D7319_28660 [Streptomyces radicis]RKN14815.1 hypothetical protein D7318_28415 [Streptomyces radicis]
MLLLHPLIALSDEGHWPGRATALVVVGALAPGAFALHQRRARARGGTPLVEPTQFLQVGVGMGSVKAGLAIAPWAVAVGAGAALGAAGLLVATLAATFLLPSPAATRGTGAGTGARAGAEPTSPRTPVAAADEAREARAPGA